MSRNTAGSAYARERRSCARSLWRIALTSVGDTAHLSESVPDVEDAVSEAWETFVAEMTEFGLEVDKTEFDSSVANVMIGSGFHRDRAGRVRRLSDLISVRDVRLGYEGETPCVLFSIRALLEDGTQFVSRETLEWLGEDGNPVSIDCHLDTNPEALVEIARALDAYMTDVEAVVLPKLQRAVELGCEIERLKTA